MPSIAGTTRTNPADVVADASAVEVPLSPRKALRVHIDGTEGDSLMMETLEQVRLALQGVLTNKQVATTSEDPGQNLSLSATTAFRFVSKVCPSNLAVFSAPLVNTAALYLAFHGAVTSGATGTGIELQPGDSVVLPVSNTNQVYAITGTATQNVHALAL